jgi:hypothetical protein
MVKALELNKNIFKSNHLASVSVSLVAHTFILLKMPSVLCYKTKTVYKIYSEDTEVKCEFSEHVLKNLLTLNVRKGVTYLPTKL